MIEKNEKSGELMEVKEQAKTVQKHPERMIVRIWLVLALICLLAGLIAQYTFRLKEPLFLHYSQSAYLGCGLDGVETSEDGIVPSVSSEALEEESTDSDVKVGVLDEGVKDPNANMGLENTVSLYALGEESVDETDRTSDVWYTQVNFAYLTDVTDEICVREIRFSELPELQMQEMRETVQSAGQYALHRLDATLSIEDPQHNGIRQWRILTRAQVLYSDGNTADVKIGNLVLIANPGGRERPGKSKFQRQFRWNGHTGLHRSERWNHRSKRLHCVSRGDGKFFDDPKWRAYPSQKRRGRAETADSKNG